MQLPYSDELEIQYLSRLFDNTSECYKFFWFQAIVRRDYEAAVTLLDRIPPEIVNAYARMPAGRRGKANEEVL